MKEFVAVYTPKKMRESGPAGMGELIFDTALSERVLVVKILPLAPEVSSQVIFIDSIGRLQAATIDCFTACELEW